MNESRKMSDILTIAMTGTAGLLLGVLFFGGLWFTVYKGAASERPAVWFFGSFVLRMSIVLSGFYLASGGHWQWLLTCLLGFAVGRFIVMTLTRLPEEGRQLLASRFSNAP